MANTIFKLQITSDDGGGFLPASNIADSSAQVRELINWLEGALAGRKKASNLDIFMTGVKASGTLTISSGAGSVGGTIGGTSVTVTWATSDTASAAALVTAINANSTVNKWVVATSSAGVVTLTALEAGHIGNNVTLVASGTGVTASGAKLTGGSNATKVSHSAAFR